MNDNYLNKYNNNYYMKVHFITFGAGEQNYYDATERLYNQAKNICLFDNITVYTDRDLKMDDEFWRKHNEFIENNKRGYGYWLWKPYIIKKTMEKMEDGDILLYLDCGCEIDIRNSKNFKYYFELVKKYYIIGTTTGCKESDFNKTDLLLFLDMVDNKYLNSEQQQAGASLFYVFDKTRKLVNEWYEVCCNYHFIDDSPSICENSYGFVEHRHDQSVFSLLIKKYNMYHPEESLFNCISYHRNKSGVSNL
jgi:hypothetical protein